ncbi:MAG: DNA/RNA nuclease SfsA [Desulfovibrio sp.]|nr:DNA/RNA nuclease SfsA [Desulfovibrio sp.]
MERFEESNVLLPFGACCFGRFITREKRFSVLVELDSGEKCWAHTNNTGAMLGLLRRGERVLLSKAENSARKLPFTLEAVCRRECLPKGIRETWVGVNTRVPNALLEAGFLARRLPFLASFTIMQREKTRGKSRLDAWFSGSDGPDFWVECKNVTLVEDGVAAFPDAPSARACKHLIELMDIVRSGERAGLFLLVQRNDAHCFGAADYIDRHYATLFSEARDSGVEIFAYTTRFSLSGITLGEPLPLVPKYVF